MRAPRSGGNTAPVVAHAREVRGSRAPEGDEVKGLDGFSWPWLTRARRSFDFNPKPTAPHVRSRGAESNRVSAGVFNSSTSHKKYSEQEVRAWKCRARPVIPTPARAKPPESGAPRFRESELSTSHKK